MTDITQISAALQNVLGKKADQVARKTKFVQREVKITGSNFAQTLVFGFLDNPKMSYREMAQAAGLSNLEITGQGLEQRFNEASADFMQAVLENAIAQMVCSASDVDIDLLDRFSKIHIQDGSVIGLPDECVAVWQGIQPEGEKGCSALKLHVSLEYKSGQLSGPALANGREHDKKSPWFCQTLQKGELRIDDLGFFDLDQLEADAKAGGFWITRYKHEVILQQNGQDLALLSFLQEQTNSQIDVPVELGKNHHLPCRLIAFKVDDRTAEKRKRKLREYARKKGVSLSEERLRLAHWTLFLTNAPQDMLSTIDVFALYRLRWQIELLFRLWKSYSFIDESNSQNPWRVLTEVYAKLIAVLVQHWILLVSVWHIPDKSIVLACATIRKFAALLHINLADTSALSKAISTIVNALKTAPRLLKRKCDPSNFQVLSSPDLALR
jgi:hypothetical protein